MTDPRTVLRETLAHQLLITRQARDALWEDYWANRRVVVVPDAQDDRSIDEPTDESPEMRIHRRDWNDAQSTIAALRQAWPKLQDRERKNILGSSDSFDAALGAYLNRSMPERGAWSGPIPEMPDGEPVFQRSVQETPGYQVRIKERDEKLNQTIATMQAGVVLRDCIARLKAAREKEAVNKNLSTLLAVVVKVQRDLEALLNGGAR